MAAAFLTQSVDSRTQLANALAKAAALVYSNVQNQPVGYQDDVMAALVSASTLVAAAVLDSSSSSGSSSTSGSTSSTSGTTSGTTSGGSTGGSTTSK